MNPLEKYSAKKFLREKLAKKKNHEGLLEGGKALGLTLGGAGVGHLISKGQKDELSRWARKGGYHLTPEMMGVLKKRALAMRLKGAVTGAAISSILWGLKKHKERRAEAK